MINKKLEEQRGVRTFLSNINTNKNNDLFGVEVIGLPIGEDQSDMLFFQEYHELEKTSLDLSLVLYIWL